MTMDSAIDVKTIVEIAVPIIGFIGVWFTSRERLNQLWKKSEGQEKQHDENQKRLSAIELQIARDCVKTDDFRRLEDRFVSKFEKLEHSVNNNAFKVAGMVKDMLRDVLPARTGRGAEE